MATAAVTTAGARGPERQVINPLSPTAGRASTGAGTAGGVAGATRRRGDSSPSGGSGTAALRERGLTASSITIGDNNVFKAAGGALSFNYRPLLYLVVQVALILWQRWSPAAGAAVCLLVWACTWACGAYLTRTASEDGHMYGGWGVERVMSFENNYALMPLGYGMATRECAHVRVCDPAQGWAWPRGRALACTTLCVPRA